MSLEEYFLVSQDKRQVESFYRSRMVSGRSALHLKSWANPSYFNRINIEVPLAQIYDSVEFPSVDPKAGMRKKKSNLPILLYD